MTAASIAQALNGKRNGRRWLVRCPAHDDRDPSLSIAGGENGKLLVRCFAGCDARDVLAALRRLGLLDAPSAPTTHCRQEDDERRRIEFARKLWRETHPAEGSPVETYLRARGYTGMIPPTLRHHPALKHKETGLHLPAMVAGVCIAPGRAVTGIHRTFLTATGKAKAPVSNPKMMLGNVSGGAVRLAPAGETLAISEGIETGLSILQATALPTWAALSAGGIERLALPPLPLAREVIICADHDANGVGRRAAEKAAQRWIAENRHVRIAMPTHAGEDFNDLLRGAA